MKNQRIWMLSFLAFGVTWASNLTCNTSSDCEALAESLQVAGTQESFVESTVVLYAAFNRWSDDYTLWSSYGKLNLFYTLNWQIAKDAIDKSLSLDNSPNNLNSFLYAGWLHSTMQYRDVETAAKYFESAIDLIPSSNNPSNFWPYFEYAVFLSHIAEDFDESQRFFEFAVNASSLKNPFIAFFYGLLVEYHLDDVTDLDGNQLIQSALQAGEAGSLPGQAASNMVFQGVLLDSMGRVEEAKRCCEFSAAILNQNVSDWYLFCPNINDREDSEIENGVVDNDEVESAAVGVGEVNLAWVGLAMGMMVIWW